MSKRAAKSSAPSAIEIVEEGVRLLRRAPASVILCHLLGGVPCLLGGLLFFADLSRSATAESHVLEASLSFAALYIWMKCWQAVGASLLREALLGQTPTAWTPARVLRLVAGQALLQPLGLVFRATALFFVLPHVWTANFFHNVTVLGDGTPAGVLELCSRAWSEAKRWPKQAHFILVLLSVLGFFIFLNVAALMAFVPALLKMCFGIETDFSRHPGGMFNPTFILAALALSYLCFDPIRKAVIILRCFYGRSVRTGEDLVVELQNLRPPAARGAVLVAVALFAFLPTVSPSLRAELPPAPVESTELNRRIDEVLERREFTWRAPREVGDIKKVEETWLSQWKKDFDEKMRLWLQKGARAIGKFFKAIKDWLFGDKGDTSTDTGGGFWTGSVKFFMWLCLGISAVLLAILIARRWRLPRTPTVTAAPLPVQPDLNADNVTADQLPEDGWIQLARDLMQQGEFRLALRAGYLASLAHLSQRELIRLAKHKSNRDYDLELRRRARSQNDLLDAFGRNLFTFESVWYGDHPVTSDSLTAFNQNLDRIRTC